MVLYEPRTSNQMQRNTLHTSETFEIGRVPAEEHVNIEPKVVSIRSMTSFSGEYISEKEAAQ
jgi:hypothetical protein